MHKLRVNPLALQDLQEIKDYITHKLCNPDAALNVTKGIVKTYESLVQTPYIGKRLSAVIDIKTDFRYCISGSYLVFYRVDNDYVSVYRVLYGRRDYARILFGSLPEKDMED